MAAYLPDGQLGALAAVDPMLWGLAGLTVLLGLILLVFVVRGARQQRQSAAREQAMARDLETARRQWRSAVNDTRALLDHDTSVVLVFERSRLTLLYANQQALELFGCTSVDEVSERVLMNPDAWQPKPHALLDFERWLDNLRSTGTQRSEWLFTGAERQGIWMDCVVANTAFEGQPARLMTGHNIHAYKTDRAADRLRNRVLTAINTGEPLDTVIDSLCTLAETRLGDGRCQIALYDSQRDRLVNHGTSTFARALNTALPSVPATYGATSIGTAAFTKARVLCDRIQDDHRWQGYTHVVAQVGVQAVWSEPVLGCDGALLGVISLFSQRMGTPDESRLQEMTAIVSLAGLAVERQQWRERLEASADREKFVRELGVDMVNLPGGDGFLTGFRELLQRVVAHYGLGALVVWERSAEDRAFRPLAGSNIRAPSAPSGDDHPGLPEARLDGQGLIAGPQYLTGQHDLYHPLRLSEDGRPVLILPLPDVGHGTPETRPLGFVTAQSRHVFIAQDIIEHLQVIASMIRTVLLNRRLVQSLSAAMEREQSARQKLESELSVARTIQMSMVPGGGRFREQYRNWTIEAWLHPAKAVGGDLYEFIRLPGGNILVAVGDVSDKGAPAALFMARTVSLLNFLARSFDGDLARIAPSLNRELCRANDACMFVTMVLGTLDLATGDCTWVNAGHNPPMLADAHIYPRLLNREPDSPFGLYEDATYRVGRATIGEGQSVTLYSDGVTEAFDANGQEFGDDRLLSMGYRAASQAEGPLDFMRAQVGAFIGDAGQSDDITLMTIQHHGL